MNGEFDIQMDHLEALPINHQRSRGEVRLAFKRREATSVLDRLRQDGCLKVRFPRSHGDEGVEAVMLNSSGGVAGGDRLRTAVTAGAGTRVIVASQAAERFYRALPESWSMVENSVDVQAGASLEWLPQESIVFDGAALRRTLRIELAGDAAFLGVESVVFGRTAMGETVERADLSDLIEVRRAGRLLLHDRIRLGQDVAAQLARPALGRGARAVATLIQVGNRVDLELDALRGALAPFEAGASEWDGMLVARIVAADGACLRAAVVAGLAVLRAGRPLPRVWSC